MVPLVVVPVLEARNRLFGPHGHAISHYNLSEYLRRPSLTEESPLHQLAALAYWAVIRAGEHLQTSLRNLAVRCRRARREGARYALPRVADLAARPEFEALRRFLHDRQANSEDLQQEIDAPTAQVQRMVESEP
jgi:hypothetical protein